jgi:hypothetical protein
MRETFSMIDKRWNLAGILSLATSVVAFILQAGSNVSSGVYLQLLEAQEVMRFS